MQGDLFAPVELKDIRRDLNHWKDTADSMAKNYPKHQYAVVEDMFGNYVCMPITAKFERDIIYQTGAGDTLEVESKDRDRVEKDKDGVINGRTC